MPNDYIEEGRQTKLTFWGLGQMMKGAGYAFVFLLVIGVFLWAIYLIGLLLPEESRQTPSPFGSLQIETIAQGHDIA